MERGREFCLLHGAVDVSPVLDQGQRCKGEECAVWRARTAAVASAGFSHCAVRDRCDTAINGKDRKSLSYSLRDLILLIY